jgi:hypothetical protein
MRNLYWLREVETEPALPERDLVRAAREDADGVVTVFRRREIGLPSFVIGGLLIPLVATGWRVAQGVAFSTWWVAAIVSLTMVLVVVGASWIILRGAAMASRRIRLSTRGPLEDLWRTVGNCGSPPMDESRKFATVAIALTVCAWIVVPAAVGVSLAR